MPRKKISAEEAAELAAVAKKMEMDQFKVAFEVLASVALKAGFVVTISQVPTRPLAMGRFDTVVELREARKLAPLASESDEESESVGPQ
jgi:hypothetical protein